MIRIGDQADLCRWIYLIQYRQQYTCRMLAVLAIHTTSNLEYTHMMANSLLLIIVPTLYK